MRKSFLGLALVVICTALAAQQALNNENVIKLVKAGLSDDVIITTINASQGSYDTSTDGLVALKGAGVSDKVIAAIIVKASSHPASTDNPVPTQEPENKPATSTTPATAPQSDAQAATSSEPGTVTASGHVPSGSRVVIAPMGGFETYFAAAVREKKVPVTLTLDRTSAQYFVVSTNTEWQGFVYGASGASSGRTSAFGSSASSTRGLEASIMLVDAKSKDIVWAYEVHKNSHGALIFGTFGARGQQSIAEACAKHLKEFIEKGK